ncbi:MAG TPA: adenylate/guanylate cyclase domain-containing protein [Chitinophagaceae bacterium]|nr:adenylate/guanylate cyclase domain-containing protein [Chitinophagaceae bacterium]
MSLSAQDRKIDSLSAIINSNAEDSTKVLTHIELAKAYKGSDPEKLLIESNKALDLAKSIEYNPGIALGYKWVGFYYYDRSSFIEAQDWWLKSLEAYKIAGDLDGEANMLNNLGSIHFNLGNFGKALEYFLPSYELSEKYGLKLRLATATNNIGLIYAEKPGTYTQALEYLRKALVLAEELNDEDNIGTSHANIGDVYVKLNKDTDALAEYIKAKEAMGTNSTYLPYVQTKIGMIYQRKGDYKEAQKWLDLAYTTSKELNSLFFISQTCLAIGENYRLAGDHEKAVEYFNKAREYASESKASVELKMSYKGLANLYADQKNYRLAYINESIYSRMSDSLNLFKADEIQSKFEMGLKEKEIDIANKQSALKDEEIKRTKLVRNAFLVGFALVLTLIGVLYRDYRNKIKTNKLLDQRKAEIEALLLNILPFEVAEELQKTGKSNPRYYESTTVMFTDFVGFSRIAETLSPQQITAELNEFFTEMDEIIDRYGLEKIKTIGDSYMCAGGIPTPNSTHPIDAVRAGLDIVEYLRKKNKIRLDAGLAQWEIRIGLNTGSLVAGVVGKKKYAYDIWGSAVNIASRMESNGSPGVLNISSSTYELIKDKFECEYRGKIYAKNVGEIDMYFVKREITNGKLQAHSGESVSSEQ